MKRQINVSCGGVGFLGLLTIVFITLKLCNVINWSWWWVTMPLWVFPVACLWGAIIAVIVCFFTFMFNRIMKRK